MGQAGDQPGAVALGQREQPSPLYALPSFLAAGITRALALSTLGAMVAPSLCLQLCSSALPPQAQRYPEEAAGGPGLSITPSEMVSLPSSAAGKGPASHSPAAGLQPVVSACEAGVGSWPVLVFRMPSPASLGDSSGWPARHRLRDRGGPPQQLRRGVAPDSLCPWGSSFCEYQGGIQVIGSSRSHWRKEGDKEGFKTKVTKRKTVVSNLTLALRWLCYPRHSLKMGTAACHSYFCDCSLSRPARY